jgi:hypothetical protein
MPPAGRQHERGAAALGGASRSGRVAGGASGRGSRRPGVGPRPACRRMQGLRDRVHNLPGTCAVLRGARPLLGTTTALGSRRSRERGRRATGAPEHSVLESRRRVDTIGGLGSWPASGYGRLQRQWVDELDAGKGVPLVAQVALAPPFGQAVVLGDSEADDALADAVVLILLAFALSSPPDGGGTAPAAVRPARPVIPPSPPARRVQPGLPPPPLPPAPPVVTGLTVRNRFTPRPAPVPERAAGC